MILIGRCRRERAAGSFEWLLGELARELRFRLPAALIGDLKQHGMLNDTLVVWGGEFGRTVHCQGWPAAAPSPEWYWGRRTTTDATSWPIRFTRTICRPPSCTASESTTSG
jgi:hypothetical protein